MQRPKFTLGILAAALLGAAAGGAHADIYRYVDESGKVHFTNVPNDSRYKLFIATNKEPDAVTTTLNNRYRPYSPSDRRKYHAHILAAARAYALEPALIHAVISAESGYNPLARSAKGAKGLMQLMPDTAKRYGVDNPLDPEQNIQGGCGLPARPAQAVRQRSESGAGRVQRRRGQRDRVRQHPALSRDQAVRAEGTVVLQEVQDDDVELVRRSSGHCDVRLVRCRDGIAVSSLDQLGRVTD